MNTEQKQSIIRQLIMAVASLVVSYGLIGESDTVLLVPLITAVVLWIISPSRSIASALRKIIQFVPPVLTHYHLVTAAESAAWVSILLILTSISTSREKA